MPYAVIGIINGNYIVHAECSSLKQAMVSFDQWAASLWNDAGTKVARIRVIDQTFAIVNGASQEIIPEQVAE